jgi:DNA-binding response OmpR family regulator
MDDGSAPRGAAALVVDDDASLRMLVRVSLELEGFSIEEAATVAEADRAIAASRPDVVVLDVRLGREESKGLLDRIRGAGIPVLLVTGSVAIADYEGLADAVLAKPFAPTDLAATVRRLARVDS